MLEIYLFYLSSIVIVLLIIRLINIFVGHAANLPTFLGIDLLDSWILYPSIGFQVYFWTDYLGLFK